MPHSRASQVCSTARFFRDYHSKLPMLLLRLSASFCLWEFVGGNDPLLSSP